MYSEIQHNNLYIYIYIYIYQKKRVLVILLPIRKGIYMYIYHNIGDVLKIKMKIMAFSGILETQGTILLGKMFNF